MMRQDSITLFRLLISSLCLMLDTLYRCCPSSPRGRPPCRRGAGTPRHPTWICKCNQQLRQSSPPCPAHTRHLLSPLTRERNTMLRSIIYYYSCGDRLSQQKEPSCCPSRRHGRSEEEVEVAGYQSSSAATST